MSGEKTKIGLLGASGKMGQTILGLISSEFKNQASVVASPEEGGSIDGLFSSDVVIDFSRPGALVGFSKQAAALASQPGKKLPAVVTGTTGWTAEEWAVVEKLATQTHLLFSSNFSIGVYLLRQILKTASPLLLQAGYIPSMVEKHHVHKVDSPSGTARTLAEEVSPKNPLSVPIQSIREGEIIGDHEVLFQGPADKIVLGHFAQDRSIFARGAIEVALWLSTQRTKPVTGKVWGMENFFNERYSNK